VGTCELLDATWLQHKASYMEFPMVMAATKKAVEGVLTSGQCDTAQVCTVRTLVWCAPLSATLKRGAARVRTVAV
jgi:hypothetical protein